MNASRMVIFGIDGEIRHHIQFICACGDIFLISRIVLTFALYIHGEMISFNIPKRIIVIYCCRISGMYKKTPRESFRRPFDNICTYSSVSTSSSSVTVVLANQLQRINFKASTYQEPTIAYNGPVQALDTPRDTVELDTQRILLDQNLVLCQATLT